MEQATIDGLEVRVHRGGRGPELLYLHSGLGEVGRTPFLERVAERFSVLAPELPGFGGSQVPRWHRVEDAVFFLRCLLDHYAWPLTHVVGSSVGGWLGAELAVWFPDRVRSLALFDPVGIRVDGAPLTDTFLASREKMMSDMFVQVPHDYEAALGEALEASDGNVILHSYKALEAAARIGWNPLFCDPHLLGRLGRCPLPATVVWAEGDGVVPKAYAEAYAAAFPDGHLVTMAECGHVPVVEAPDRAATVLADALDAVPA